MLRFVSGVGLVDILSTKKSTNTSWGSWREYVQAFRSLLRAAGGGIARRLPIYPVRKQFGFPCRDHWRWRFAELSLAGCGVPTRQDAHVSTGNEKLLNCLRSLRRNAAKCCHPLLLSVSPSDRGAIQRGKTRDPSRPPGKYASRGKTNVRPEERLVLSSVHCHV